MDLLVIGGINFTQHIKVPSYKVNKTEVFKEWENLNHVKRKDFERYKVMGSFTLLYDNETELNQFLDTVKNLKAQSRDSSIPITVYLNDQHTTATITAYVKYTLANEKPYFGRSKVSGFEVSIEEK